MSILVDTYSTCSMVASFFISCRVYGLFTSVDFHCALVWGFAYVTAMCPIMQEASTKRLLARSYSKINVTFYFMSVHKMQSYLFHAEISRVGVLFRASSSSQNLLGVSCCKGYTYSDAAIYLSFLSLSIFR
jgi:hypothetical protein